MKNKSSIYHHAGNYAKRVLVAVFSFFKKRFTHNYCDTCGFTKDNVYVTEFCTEAGIIQEEYRKYSTDTLMANGGSLRFEKALENVVETELKKRGLMLLSFSAQLEFSEKVRNKIDTINEVNTNLSVLDQQISEQRKRNELAQLKAEENRIISSGITPQLLQQQFVEKWDGKTALYSDVPTLLKTVK